MGAAKQRGTLEARILQSQERSRRKASAAHDRKLKVAQEDREWLDSLSDTERELVTKRRAAVAARQSRSRLTFAAIMQMTRINNG